MVNVSGRTLDDPSVPAMLRRALFERRVDLLVQDLGVDLVQGNELDRPREAHQAFV